MRYWILLALFAGCGPMYQAPGSSPPPLEPVGEPEANDPRGVYDPDDPDDPSGPSDVSDPRGPTSSGPRGPGGPSDPYADSSDPVFAAPSQRKPAKRSTAPTSEAQAMVDAHNRARARHCAAPLTWSPKLAQVAQQWANQLRDRGCMFGHSGGSHGENLAAGTSGTLDAEAVVKMWYEEVAHYKFSSGGFSMQTGHFTQVVWRGTRQVGCGRSQCKGMDIWVCEYDPAGNWQGQYRENVLPTGCR